MERLTNSTKERNRTLVRPDAACAIRRRGNQLLIAIFQATIDLLAEHGYADLSLEGVAHRAGTGKASLYRRWNSKVDLVIDALEYEINLCEVSLDLADLRAGLIAKMSSMSTAFSGNLGRAIAGCVSEFPREPKLQRAAEEKIINPRKGNMIASLELAADAGLIRRPAISPVITDLPFAFMMRTLTFEGRSPNDGEIANFVDTVMLPLLQA